MLIVTTKTHKNEPFNYTDSKNRTEM